MPYEAILIINCKNYRSPNDLMRPISSDFTNTPTIKNFVHCQAS